MQNVYILLTRSKTAFSRLIHVATLAQYTHSSLCVSDRLNMFFSFGRKHRQLPFPSGFVKEQLDTGYFGAHPNTDCLLLELRVEESACTSLLERIRDMQITSDCYHYSVLGILFLVLDKEHKSQHHYFCSQFVGELLEDSGAVQLPKPASLMQPIDLQIFLGAGRSIAARFGVLMPGAEQERGSNMIRQPSDLTEKRRKILAGAGIVVFILFFVLTFCFVGIPMLRFVSAPDQFRNWVDEQGVGAGWLSSG